MDLSACLCAAKCCGSLFGLKHVDRPACFECDCCTVLELDEAHCGIFYFESVGIPRSEEVAFGSVLKRTELVENAAGNGLNIVVVHAPQCDIESMCSDVDQGTAALCSLVHEYAPGRYAATADRMSLAVIDVAELALLTSCVQVLHLASEAVLVTYRKLLAGLLPCFDHLLCLDRAVGHGLLAVNMLACLKSCDRDLAVGYVRCADMYDFYFGICQQLFIICVDSCAGSAELLRCLLCSLYLNVAECYDLIQVCIVLKCREMFLVCNSAASDYAKFQFAHFVPPCVVCLK